MYTKKLFQFVAVCILMLGYFAPASRLQPPVVNDCTTPSQPYCGG